MLHLYGDALKQFCTLKRKVYQCLSLEERQKKIFSYSLFQILILINVVLLDLDFDADNQEKILCHGKTRRIYPEKDICLAKKELMF